MSERRVLLLESVARRIRVHDGWWFAGAALAAIIVFVHFRWIGGGAGFALFVLLALAVVVRRSWGNRSLDARTQELMRSEQAGLSLATAEALIERLPDPLLLLDEEGRIVFSNAATQGFVTAGGTKRHVSAVLRAPGVLEAVELVLSGAPAQSVEYSHLVPVERHILAYVAPIPLRPANGAPEGRGAIIVLHDLTAQKRSEQMRADFVANASHELRTPLASLSGFIDTLRGHARDDPAARERFLEIMREQASRMSRLIEDLLSLSRIELNEHIRPEGRVSLRGVVSDVVDALSPQAAAKSVKLETDVAEGAGDVNGARDELIQVVQNLVDNAIKYGSSGGRIVIRAGKAPEREGRRAAFVSVEDFGEGIAREHLPRLTERFYRIDVQRSRQTGGTGLGLAIVKHIVNRHRGSLSIESTPGKGSIFTVILPQAPEDAKAVPASEAKEARLAQPAA